MIKKSQEIFFLNFQVPNIQTTVHWRNISLFTWLCPVPSGCSIISLESSSRPAARKAQSRCRGKKKKDQPLSSARVCRLYSAASCRPGLLLVSSSRAYYIHRLFSLRTIQMMHVSVQCCWLLGSQIKCWKGCLMYSIYRQNTFIKNARWYTCVKCCWHPLFEICVW